MLLKVVKVENDIRYSCIFTADIINRGRKHYDTSRKINLTRGN